ncbi:MAG: CoB--CoM heterodisulfide reductase iron-sulfur subunit B family protein [Candidatus Thorarchaeota archaeon]
MKEFVLYTGCTTPVRLPAYEKAVELVMEKLGVRLVTMKDANCCGAQYIESVNHVAFAAMSGRILALAESMNMDILAICGACSGSLKHVKHDLDNNEELLAEVNDVLEEEGLKYTGNVQVKHLLQIFREDIGYDAIRSAVVNPYKDVRLAAHYGCHVTRPEEIVQVDNAENPTIIDQIIRAAGGTAVDYNGKTRCCGGPLLAMDEEVGNAIGRDKIENIRAENADGIITACVFCDIQLTQVQFGEGSDDKPKIPVITLPQFLGHALGIDGDSLGIQLIKIKPQAILEAH